MLKNFRSYGGNCDTPIIVNVTVATLFVLYDGDNGPTSELSWDKSMTEHTIEEKHEPNEKVEGGMEKMLSLNAVIISTLTGPQVAYCINNIWHGKLMQ